MEDQLRTTVEVMDALGGNQAVERITGRSPQAVSNWRRFQTFPANTYAVMTHALSRIGKTAPPSLWGQTELTEAAL